MCLHKNADPVSRVCVCVYTRTHRQTSDVVQEDLVAVVNILKLPQNQTRLMT